MHVEAFAEYCLAKKGVEDSFPFDETTLVFKVMGKMFALTGLDNDEFKVNLKCDPERSAELREEYAEIEPGFHMNKFHWNTVNFEGELSDSFLKELIDDSYNLVVAKFTKKIREEYDAL